METSLIHGAKRTLRLPPQPPKKRPFILSILPILFIRFILVSNGKLKARNNAKCGNRYLAWAFVEAANSARRYDGLCRRWYDRKAAKTNPVLATKALGCKLAKAASHVMARACDYDPKRMFPPGPGQTRP